MSSAIRAEFAPPDAMWARVYFGSDFCQSLLPTASTLLDTISTNNQAAFTLVTPPVNDQGLRRIEPLFTALDASLSESKGPLGCTEVVVNDWGVLGLVKQHPGLTPVLGRLLTRMLRDPRITEGEGASLDTSDASRVLRQSGVTSQPFRDLIKSLGVRRVEIDPVVQGVTMDFVSMGLSPSLHVPFGYVTTGRVCLFAAMGQPAAQRFEAGASCHLECRRFASTMVVKGAGAQAQSARLITAGNTVFQRHSGSSIEGAWAAMAVPGARLVVRSEPFDELARATEDPEVARRWLKENIS